MKSRRILPLLIVATACGTTPETDRNLATTTDRSPEVATPRTDQDKPATSTQRRRIVDTARQFRASVGKALDNGMLVVRVPAHSGELAHVELAIEAGSMRDPLDKAGLAELTAFSLRATNTRPLDQVLDDLGAELLVAVSDRLVRITGSCPPASLDKLVETLFEMVTQAAPTPAIVRREIERLQQARRETADVRERAWQIATCLGHVRPSPAQVIDETKTLKARDVLLFQSSYYRPQVAVLAFSSPSGDDALLERIVETMTGWKKAGKLPEPEPGGDIQAISYAVDDHAELAELITLVPSPAPEQIGQSGNEVAWQILCMDGFGGILQRRLSAKQLTHVLGTVEDIAIGRSMARALVLKLVPEQVADAMDAVREAFREAATTAATDAQVETARSRALLAWDLRMAAPGRRLRTYVDGFLAGRDHEIDKIVVRSITEVDRLELPELVRVSLRPAFLVRGPANSIPKGANRIKNDSRRRSDRERTKPEALDLSEDERTRLRDQVLERTIRQLGGHKALTALELVSYDAHRSIQSSIPFVESWTISLSKPEAERDRRILGTSIRTKLNGTAVTQTVGPSTRDLSEQEALLFRLESQLHPAVLLHRLANPETAPPRLIGRILSGKRELLVLELPIAGGQLVRIALDAKNGLPRRVEYEEWRPKSPPRHVMLLWRHYAKPDQPVTGKPAVSRGLFGRLRVPRLVYRYVEGRFVGEAELFYR